MLNGVLFYWTLSETGVVSCFTAGSEIYVTIIPLNVVYSNQVDLYIIIIIIVADYLLSK
jgi:hypothetical protein